MRQSIVDMVRHHEQDELEIEEVWSQLYPEDSKLVPRLLIMSLTNLGILEENPRTHFYHVNESLLRHLTGKCQEVDDSE